MTTPAEPRAAEPDAPPAPQPTSAPQRGDRFFLWIAGLGVARSEGWLGGVAAGIAARLRIDPLIVRGVLVVAALFGLPVIFLYAVAWALLPDADGRTHARDLLRRDYQPVQLGILATAVVGLVPTAPLTGTIFGFGYVNWSALAVLSWIVGLVMVVILLILIVRAASRTPGAPVSDLPMASADPTAPDAPVTLGESGTPEGAGAPSGDPGDGSADAGAGTADAGTDSTDAGAASAAYAWPEALRAPLDARPEPPAAPVANDAESVAAWKEQHAAWKEQDQVWRRGQQDAERAVRDQLRRERQATAAVFAAQAAEQRRVRRASNPRASFAYVAAVIGLAAVVGAGVGLWSGLGSAAGAIGAMSAALVLALGMIVAGALRRRSGFLAFVTATVLIGGLIAGTVSTLPQFTLGWASITNDRPVAMTQPFGDLFLSLEPQDGAAPPIEIAKGSGSTMIYVQPGVELDLHATVESTGVSWARLDENTGEYTDMGVWEPVNGEVDEAIAARGTDVSTVQTVTITQRGGYIQVISYNATEEQE